MNGNWFTDLILSMLAAGSLFGCISYTLYRWSIRKRTAGAKHE